MDEWITVKEAARLRNCTERNILKLIEKKELEAKKDGRRWLVLMDTSELDSEQEPNVSEMISVLKVQLEEKDAQIRNLQKQLDAAAEASQRHDTIVMQLTRQLEQSQRLLEYHRDPFWRRWFRRKRKEDRS